MVCCFVQNIFFRTTPELEYLYFLQRKARIFFPEFSIRFYNTKIRIFVYKKTITPLQVKWSVPYEGYFRKASCALTSLSTFSFRSLSSIFLSTDRIKLFLKTQSILSLHLSFEVMIKSDHCVCRQAKLVLKAKDKKQVPLFHKVKVREQCQYDTIFFLLTFRNNKKVDIYFSLHDYNIQVKKRLRTVTHLQKMVRTK